MLWRVYSSKTKKTRRIPVQREVAILTRRLLKAAPKGSGKPIFRNTKGSPWKRMTGVVRFLALKRKLNWHLDSAKHRYSCYSCRHTFAHRMLSGFWTGGVGCSIETLAELMGDTPKVAFDHYGREWGQHYQAPLWAAIGAAPNKGRAAAKGPQKDEKSRPVASTPVRGSKKRQSSKRTVTAHSCRRSTPAASNLPASTCRAAARSASWRRAVDVVPWPSLEIPPW